MLEMVVRGKFPQPVDRDVVEKSWSERGYDCHDFNDAPGQEWNGFEHSMNELVTVVEGELKLEIEEKFARQVPATRSLSRATRCTRLKTYTMAGHGGCLAMIEEVKP